MAIDDQTLAHINLALVDSYRASITDFRQSVTELLNDNSVVPRHFEEWIQSGHDPNVLESGVKQQLVDRSHRVVTPPMSNLAIEANLDAALAALLDGEYHAQLKVLKDVQRHIEWCNTFQKLAARTTVTP